MLKRERQQYILDKVNRDGSALTKDIKEEFGVAEDTVRKDFQELSALGKVRRIHGGVLKLEQGAVDFELRASEQTSVKQYLAEKTLDFVKDKRVLYIDSGSTNLKLAQILPEGYSGTLITNSPAISLVLCECKNAEVILLGGNLEKTAKVVMGSNAIGQLEEMNIECCILGVSALSPENGITFPISEETLLKRTIVNKSKQIVAIANKEKLGRVSAFYCADISVIDILVTDEINEAILEPYRQCGVQVISETI